MKTACRTCDNSGHAMPPVPRGDTIEKPGPCACRKGSPNAPRASVIIPLYNKRPWIRDCLSSVVRNRQSARLECILVDDGSTDGSLGAVRDILDGNPWIRVLTQPNAGVSAARNHAIREARSDHLLFLDADDVWDDDHARTILETWDAFPDARLVFSTPRFLVDGVPQEGMVLHGLPGCRGPVLNWLETRILGDTILNTSTLALHRSVWEECGGFREDMRVGEDIVMWSEAWIRGPVVWTGRSTGTRDLHTGSNLTFSAGQGGGVSSEDVWCDVMQGWAARRLPDCSEHGRNLWNTAWRNYLHICEKYGATPATDRPPAHPHDGLGWNAPPRTHPKREKPITRPADILVEARSMADRLDAWDIGDDDKSTTARLLRSLCARIESLEASRNNAMSVDPAVGLFRSVRRIRACTGGGGDATPDHP